MFTMLHALHVMGQHEMNFIVLVQVALQKQFFSVIGLFFITIILPQLSVLAYELLRPRHPCIVDVLALIPGKLSSFN